MARTWQDKVKDDAEGMFRHIGFRITKTEAVPVQRLAAQAQAHYDQAGEAARQNDVEWALTALQLGAQKWGQVLELTHFQRKKSCKGA